MTITRFKLPVTQECINGGECGSEKRCAIALALLDLFGDAHPEKRQVSVRVSTEDAIIDVGDIECFEFMPEDEFEWYDFIDDFDDKRPVSPTTFTLEGHDLPEWMLARIKERDAWRAATETPPTNKEQSK